MYHIVFIPKYCCKAMYGKLGEEVGQILSTVCKITGIDLIRGGVAFTSKSDLVEYYKEKLNAGVFRDRRMYIDENAAQILLKIYEKVWQVET